jgi:hypothetical protein
MEIYDPSTKKWEWLGRRSAGSTRLTWGSLGWTQYQVSSGVGLPVTES